MCGICLAELDSQETIVALPSMEAVAVRFLLRWHATLKFQGQLTWNPSWPGGTLHVVVGTLKISLDRLKKKKKKKKKEFSRVL